MRAIILAAGYATRLYPLTRDYPKPLLEVGGRPIVDWLIEDTARAVDGFIVVTNHRFSDQFRKWRKGRPERITVIDDGTSTNETRLGAVADMQLAAWEPEDYLVMAADNLLDFSLEGFLGYQRRVCTSCVMCHEERSLSALQRTAVITTDADGRITSFEEKPLKPRGSLAVPPFYIYRAEDIARIGEALEDGCGRDAPGSFAAWLSARTPMHAYPMPGRRYDIGDLASYRAVKERFGRA